MGLLTPEDRHIPFRKCFNFRDLGGYRTHDGRSLRWRLIFRSGAVHRMTPEDAELAWRTLGIKTVFDLRTQEEIDTNGKGGPLLLEPVRYYHVPLVDELKRPQPAPADSPEAAKPVDYSRGYYRVALRAGDRIATILTRLADNQHCPAVLHCTSGRDRTGIVAAVLLGTLGILDEDIVSDYTQSSLYLQNAPELRRNTAATAGVPASSTDHGQQANSRPLTPEEIAPPDRMWSLLNTARKEHGSMEAFALALGVRADTIKLLKESLLE